MLDYKFPINTCPLCGAKLLSISYSSNDATWECPGDPVISLPAGLAAHYQVELDLETAFVVQHMFVFPYSLNTYSTSGQTKIHVWNNNNWSYIMTMPQIKPDTYDKLLERIKVLVVFS